MSEQTEVTRTPMKMADGLTRLKIIKKQLRTLADYFERYSAWSNKKKHPLGDTKSDTKTALKQAKEDIDSKYQSYMDLITEFKDLKRSIDYTNLQHTITVAGKDMKVYDAVIYRKTIKPYYDSLEQAFGEAIDNANYEVESYNKRLSVPEEDKKTCQADVEYLIDKTKVEEIHNFNDVFLTEVDGKLNTFNALTDIIWM